VERQLSGACCRNGSQTNRSAKATWRHLEILWHDDLVRAPTSRMQHDFLLDLSQQAPLHSNDCDATIWLDSKIKCQPCATVVFGKNASCFAVTAQSWFGQVVTYQMPGVVGLIASSISATGNATTINRIAASLAQRFDWLYLHESTWILIEWSLL
jgi:hypothetical protein